jgi:hypothetical protein
VQDDWAAMVRELVDRHYLDVARYTTSGFLRAKLGPALALHIARRGAAHLRTRILQSRGQDVQVHVGAHRRWPRSTGQPLAAQGGVRQVGPDALDRAWQQALHRQGGGFGEGTVGGAGVE